MVWKHLGHAICPASRRVKNSQSKPMIVFCCCNITAVFRSTSNVVRTQTLEDVALLALSEPTTVSVSSSTSSSRFSSNFSNETIDVVVIKSYPSYLKYLLWTFFFWLPRAWKQNLSNILQSFNFVTQLETISALSTLIWIIRFFLQNYNYKLSNEIGHDLLSSSPNL